MVYTEDGGAKWKESGGGPTVRSRIFYSRDGKIVYAASPYGEFWTSSDDGKSWEAVRSSEAANRSDSDKSGS